MKVTWTEGVVLCNICYMNFVENPLKRESKRVKTTDEDEVSEKIDFTRSIKMIAKIFYERDVIIKKVLYTNLMKCKDYSKK